MEACVEEMLRAWRTRSGQLEQERRKRYDRRRRKKRTTAVVIACDVRKVLIMSWVKIDVVNNSVAPSTPAAEVAEAAQRPSARDEGL